MTSAEIPVGIWCWPGPRAAAGLQQGPGGLPVLAMFLDPVNLVLTPPLMTAEAVETVRFLRELAQAALRMATELEPAIDTRRVGGAHHALPDDESGSGITRW